MWVNFYPRLRGHMTVNVGRVVTDQTFPLPPAGDSVKYLKRKQFFEDNRKDVI